MKQVNEPDKLMTVSELAQKAGVTVRTLQYYDQVGLLSPTTTDSQNRRLYSSDDAEKLYRIIVLKYLGLTLSEIRETEGVYAKPDSTRLLLNSEMDMALKSIGDLLERISILRRLFEEMGLQPKTKWSDIANFIEGSQGADAEDAAASADATTAEGLAGIAGAQEGSEALR